MFYLAFALVIALILLGINLYLKGHTTWISVNDSYLFFTGDIISIEGKVYKVTDTDYCNHRIKIRPTMLEFIGGIFWRS